MGEVQSETQGKKELETMSMDIKKVMSKSKQEDVTVFPSHIFTCNKCPGIRCVHKIYGKRDKGATEQNKRENRKCIYRKLIEKSERGEI